jgi:hypothetical protein
VNTQRLAEIPVEISIAISEGDGTRVGDLVRELLQEVLEGREKVERLTEERDRLGAGNKRPVPDFEKCGNCEADAKANCSWDPADGWCCSKCGACDSDE